MDSHGMSELTTAITSAVIGFAGAALLMYVRDIYLYSRRIAEQRHRAIVERQLEKLYSPLYRFIKTAEFLTGKAVLAFQGSPIQSGGASAITQSPDKKYLDYIIAHYLYLAEEELANLLPRIHGVGFFNPANQSLVQDASDLIVKHYQKLRGEFYSFGLSNGKPARIIAKYRKISGWAFVVFMVAAIDRAYNQIWDIAERAYPDMLTRYENALVAIGILFILALVTGFVISKLIPNALSS
jgi:hypothetical protein